MIDVNNYKWKSEAVEAAFGEGWRAKYEGWSEIYIRGKEAYESSGACFRGSSGKFRGHNKRLWMAAHLTRPERNDRMVETMLKLHKDLPKAKMPQVRASG